jgi:hypothetical protein
MQEGAVDRPLQLVQRCEPQNHVFDVAAIAELRAMPPLGQISFAEAKALLRQLRARLADHPPPRLRHMPDDWPTRALAKFLRVGTGNSRRRLGLRETPPVHPPAASAPSVTPRAAAPAARLATPLPAGNGLEKASTEARMRGK